MIRAVYFYLGIQSEWYIEQHLVFLNCLYQIKVCALLHEYIVVPNIGIINCGKWKSFATLTCGNDAYEVTCGIANAIVM